jgi:peptide/nickel transport system substrate-binding protein
MTNDEKIQDDGASVHSLRSIAASNRARVSVFLSVLAAIGGASASSEAADPGKLETPYLAVDVKDGRLPPRLERLPRSPRVIDPRLTGGTLGEHGGVMRWLMGRPKDLRMVYYYGYARLVGYDKSYNLIADILERYEVNRKRQFTFYLRPGHKWSDGHPFTAEDFRYVSEDVYGDDRIGKGYPRSMLVDGKPPVFEVIDDLTVRYTWDKPNPEFLPAVAGTLPIDLAMPAHYAKTFHPRYAEPAKLKAAIEQAQVANARALHERMMRAVTFQNPALPGLDAWLNTTAPPSNLFIFKRNPYYHRVDPTGRQLPYVDEIHMSIGSNSLVAAKTGSGESDLQARYLRFDDYTFLKAAERKGKIKVHLWDKANGSHMAIVPNLTTKDDQWRGLLRDVRMRRALSLAIDREKINQAIFYGLARPSGDTVLPQSPLFKQKYADAWCRYDPDTANRLLDELGLDKRDSDGIRLLPGGRRAEIIIDTAGESTEQSDILQLIKDTWRKVGLALYPRATQRDLFRARAYSGESIMTVWAGHNNGLPTPATRPDFLAPVSQAQLQWPDWGLWTQTGGEQGTPPDPPAARRLLELLGEWRRAEDEAAQTSVWHEMLEIYADNLFTIGLVNSTKQPVANAPDLRNVPSEGVFAFEPGGYFGIYHPDTFWFASEANRRLAQ